MDCLYQAREHGLAVDDQAWQIQLGLLEHLEGAWREPDEGIWEIRGERRHFVHSKAMAWVAFDRAVRTVEGDHGLTGPVDRWREIRDEIHRDVCENGYSEKLGSFTQSYGAEKLDASLLLLPLFGFLPAADPRTRGTIETVARELMRDGFLLRYQTEESVDGLPAGEGVFLPCSFGRHDDAVELFERLVEVTNDLGLVSEEYDPGAKRLLGNFPQAFTHLALVNSAFNLSPHLPSPMHRRHAT